MLGLSLKKSDFYNAFLNGARVVKNDEKFTTYAFDHNGKPVIVKKTNKRATKRIIVTCSGHTVSAVHLYPVTHHTVASEEEFNIDVADMQDNNAVSVVVISGKPGLIKGLDEGIFLSANSRADGRKCVFVMSEKRFRSFEIGR